MTEYAAGVPHRGNLSGMLEPYDGKLSRTVLRGTGGRKAPWSTRCEHTLRWNIENYQEQAELQRGFRAS